MSSAPYDQVQTMYRTLLAFATVAVVILVVGLVEFVYFEPPGQTTGAKAGIVGVYAYDPASRTTVGADRSAFSRSEEVAAVVDWSGLSPSLPVDARWYDTFGTIVGRVGPSTPGQLGTRSIVPVITPAGLHHNLPGRYTFVVQRLQGGVPVEVLARRFILVERS